MREMRRFKQALTREQCHEILNRGTSGVLAVAGEDGWPYAVPLSYVWKDGRVLFHFALAGHKLDAVRREERASFCVIDRDQVVPEEYTTYYRSVIVFGRARVIGTRRKSAGPLRRWRRNTAPASPRPWRRRSTAPGSGF